jgi:hypothetical protein
MYFAMLVVPFALKNTVENKIVCSGIDHTMEGAIRYEHDVAKLYLERGSIFIAHDHLPRPLNKEVYFLLTRMSMTSRLLVVV